MIPFASPVPVVVTIHDMSLTLYPKCHPLRRVVLNRPLVDLAARRANAVITVSESSKRDIVQVYGIAARTRARRSRSCGAGVSPDSRHRRAATRAPAIQPGRSLHPLRGDDRASQEPAASHRGLCPTPADRGAHSTNSSARGPYGWLSADIEQLDRAARRRTTSFSSPGTCRSRICRHSTISRRCSSSRRCTKGSGCRSWRRWPVELRSSRPGCRRWSK